MWLGNWLAIHTVVPEGAGPGDVVYFDLPSHIYQLWKNPPDDDIRIMHSVVLPSFVDPNAELDSQSSYNRCHEDIVPASVLESFAPLVDSQDGFIPQSAPLVATQGTIIPESLPACSPKEKTQDVVITASAPSPQPPKILATAIKATAPTKITVSLSFNKVVATQSEVAKKMISTHTTT